jgi:ABC-2 type transport system ATP-binding protein
VNKGEVFGLLGPNGSGKTTTILMLLGLTEPTAGSARILGFDPVREPLKVKARVGYLPDQVGFYNDLTAYENLIYIAKLIGVAADEIPRRSQNVLERMGLSKAASQKVATFSHGMRQRLGVAEVLLKEPQVIILDEPASGLDPDPARLFHKMIGELSEEGIAILLSSHLLHQVQQVCDRVALFHRGRIVLRGTVPELAREILDRGYQIYLHAYGDSSDLLQALNALPEAMHVEHEGQGRYSLASDKDLRSKAARAVIEAGYDLMSLTVREPSLDEVYEKYFEQEMEVENVRER